VLSAPLVLPVVSPDVVEPDVGGPPLPVVPEPITDGGGDRLVVVTPAAATPRPSATLLAAQQLSDEADRYVHRGTRRTSDRIADRRHRATRALIEQRRADRSASAAS
jgi:hypothetical protein